MGWVAKAWDGGSDRVHNLDPSDGDHGEGGADLLLGVEGQVAEQAVVGDGCSRSTAASAHIHLLHLLLENTNNCLHQLIVAQCTDKP